MKNPLHALLPIHALRERRALRLVHEQNQAHLQAVQAEESKLRLQRQLEDGAAATRGGIGTGDATTAADIQWQLAQADTLEDEAVAVATEIVHLAEQSARLHAAVAEARATHLTRVRGHRKLQEACGRWDRTASRKQAAHDEQLADDEFAAAWGSSRHSREPS